MRPWLDDGDVRLYHAHVLDALRSMPDGSVDCIITSPPYYGLRDYGTGRWEGGDETCDHLAPLGGGTAATGLQRDGRSEAARQGNAERIVADRRQQYRDTCGKCGARRVDNQIGLEETPAAFITTLVSVFREARRVLADHGTCWINLGDSYAGNGTIGRKEAVSSSSRLSGHGDDGRSPYLDALTPASFDRGDLPPKNLLGMPWRTALALQDDGWILRRDIVWSKPNPMPESVTDRCTSAHEYVFMLTKRPRYWYDADAVREANSSPEQAAHNERYAKPYATYDEKSAQRVTYGHDARGNPGIHARGAAPGRNLRSVWEIATQPTPEAHFATFPEELVRRCLLAGCPLEVCRVCGKPRERIVEREGVDAPRGIRPKNHARAASGGNADREVPPGYQPTITTLGWSDCGHGAYRPGVVLDPFIGSGTTALVARKHQRHAIGMDLNAEYLAIAAKRLQQLSLLGGLVGAG